MYKNSDSEIAKSLSFSSLNKLAIVEDSQADDSEYDYEQDFARFKTRQGILKLEMEKHSRAFPPCHTKKNDRKKQQQKKNKQDDDDDIKPQPYQKSSRRQSFSSLSSLTSPSGSIHDSSDDDILSFLKPDMKPSLRGSESTKPKLTIAEILEQTKKNKARDLEIRRAQQLLEDSESTTLSASDPAVVSNINTYLKPSDGENSLIRLLKPTPTNSDALSHRFLFLNPNVKDVQSVRFKHYTLSTLWGPVIECVCGHDVGFLMNSESKIRDFLISGNFVSFLQTNDVLLDSQFQNYLLDQLCVQRDENLCITYLGVATVLPERTAECLGETGIRRLFGLLGASDELLNLDSPLQTTTSERDIEEEFYAPNWWNVSLVLKLLRKIASSLTSEQLRTVWGFAVRLSLDEKRIKGRKCHFDLMNLMETLIENLESHNYPLIEVRLSYGLRIDFPRRKTLIQIFRSFYGTCSYQSWIEVYRGSLLVFYL
ncbi:hypothetical protein TWF694_010669 [Orbilia ellipsospora]|uniref:Coiled-coil SMC6 And NSE5 INteracting (CANIN) domain-containing protein n=1 Tax=Orbilia ellipsospora TaxID=2528407 RepID=A0AAV9X9L7_9PEZI